VSNAISYRVRSYAMLVEHSMLYDEFDSLISTVCSYACCPTLYSDVYFSTIDNMICHRQIRSYSQICYSIHVDANKYETNLKRLV
jgi:hypothetical protein